MIRLDQISSFPRPFPLPKSRATSAAGALTETMERFGPQRGTDGVWAQMHGSEAWEREHMPGYVPSLNLKPYP